VLTPPRSLSTILAHSGRPMQWACCDFARKGVTHLPLLWRKEHSPVSNPSCLKIEVSSVFERAHNGQALRPVRVLAFGLEWVKTT